MYAGPLCHSIKYLDHHRAKLNSDMLHTLKYKHALKIFYTYCISLMYMKVMCIVICFLYYVWVPGL